MGEVRFQFGSYRCEPRAGVRGKGTLTHCWSGLVRKPLIRGLVGIAAFSLPAIMCIVGCNWTDQGSRHDPSYVASIFSCDD